MLAVMNKLFMHYSVLFPGFAFLVSTQNFSCHLYNERLEQVFFDCMDHTSTNSKLYMSSNEEPLPDGPQWIIQSPDVGPDKQNEVYKIGIAYKYLVTNGHIRNDNGIPGPFNITVQASPGSVSVSQPVPILNVTMTTQSPELSYFYIDLPVPVPLLSKQIVNINVVLVNAQKEKIPVLNEGNSCPKCIELQNRVYLSNCYEDNTNCLIAYDHWKAYHKVAEEYGIQCHSEQDGFINNLIALYDKCFVGPNFEYISPSVNVYLGDTVTLKCIAHGNPPPEIHWFKDGQSLHGYVNFHHIQHVTAQDTGSYVCEARILENAVNRSEPILIGLHGNDCRQYKNHENSFIQECSSDDKFLPSNLSWPEVVMVTTNAILTNVDIDSSVFEEENPEYDLLENYSYPDDTTYLPGDYVTSTPDYSDGKLVSFKVVLEVVTGNQEITTKKALTQNGINPTNGLYSSTLERTTEYFRHPGEDSSTTTLKPIRQGNHTSTHNPVEREEIQMSFSTPGQGDSGLEDVISTTKQLNNRNNEGSEEDEHASSEADETSEENRDRRLAFDSTTMPPQSVQIKEGNEITISSTQLTATPQQNSNKIIFSKTFHHMFCPISQPNHKENVRVSLSPSGVDVKRGQLVKVKILHTNGKPLEKKCDGDICTSLQYRTFQTGCNVNIHGHCLSAYLQWKNFLSRVDGQGCGEVTPNVQQLQHCESIVLPKANITGQQQYRVRVDQTVVLQCQTSGSPAPSIQWVVTGDWSHYSDLVYQSQYRFSNSNTGTYYIQCNASNIYGTAESNIVTVIVYKQVSFCSAEVLDGMTWPETPTNQHGFSVEKCKPDTEFRGKSIAKRYCASGALWKQMALQDCGRTININTALHNLTEIEVTNENVEDVATALSELTTVHSNLTIDGVADSADLIVNIVSEASSMKVSKELVTSVNNLMQVKPHTLEESQKTTNSSRKTIQALEKYLETVTLEDEKKVLKEVQSEIGFDVIEDSVVSFTQGVSFVSLVEEGKLSKDELVNTSIEVIRDPKQVIDNLTEASISLPPSILNYTESKGTVRFTFIIFQTDVLFQSSSISVFNKVYDKDQVTRRINSRIIAANIAGKRIKHLPEPVVVKLLPTEIQSEEFTNSSECVFWDFDANDGYGDWSSDGCYFMGIDNQRVVCHCYHLTNFAVLMNIHNGEVDEFHTFLLDTISRIGCIISIFGLIMTLMSYLGFKKLRKSRPQRILINLCIALLCVLLVFLAGIDQTQSYTGCILVAVLLHYFTLAAFMWMAVEAFNMYMAFVRVMPAYISHFMIKVSLIAWGLPLIGVMITLLMDVENYISDQDYCFMAQYPFYYAYVIPIGVILLCNLVIYVMVVQRLCRQPKAATMDKPQHLHMQWQIRNSFCILLLLGLTWTFAFFAIEEATLLFQYLFCICNSLQGFFIFVFYCADQREVREQWKKACSCCPCFRKKKRKYKYRSPLAGFDLIYHNPTYSTSQSNRSSISSTKQFSLSARESNLTNIATSPTSTLQPHLGFVQSP